MFIILLSMVFNHFGQAQKIVAILLDPEFKSGHKGHKGQFT